MKYIHGISTDPAFNLAFEEYVFENLNPDQDYFMLWQNDNAIIVGKYQNTLEEINLNYVKDHHIKVIRRLTGGGAVYHDLGNLNFTFITRQGESVEAFDFQFFIKPIAKALAKMGISTAFNGRNDITIDGKKFSGNSQYVKNGRILHHGTIMFNSDTSVMQKALNVKNVKIHSKGVKSVKSRVTNIIDHLTYSNLTLKDFENLLLTAMFEDNTIEEIHLTDKDVSAIELLKKNKYDTEDWNFGHSPAFDLRIDQKFDSGLVTLLLNINHQTIQSLHIFGDFFGNGNLQKLERTLTGVHFDEVSIRKSLEGFQVSDYIIGVTTEDFIALFHDYIYA